MIAPVNLPGTTGMAAAADAADRHGRLVDASQQFEGMFLQQLLHTKGVDGEKEEDGSDADSDAVSQAGSSYQDFASEALSRVLSHAGGIGIARHIVAQVEKTSTKNLPTHG